MKYCETPKRNKRSTAVGSFAPEENVGKEKHTLTASPLQGMYVDNAVQGGEVNAPPPAETRAFNLNKTTKMWIKSSLLVPTRVLLAFINLMQIMIN